MEYFALFWERLLGHGRYVVGELAHIHWHNYLYWLLAISAVVYLLELMVPWRKQQARIRRDFWLDTFYMFFNFFIFPVLGFIALSAVLATMARDLTGMLGLSNWTVVSVDGLPVWAQLLTLFLLRDFVQFNVHRLLHRVPWLWEFHKVHHSVQEMGFAAHLRYHWMENVVYRSLEFIPLAMIGYGIDDFLIVHLCALTIGHLNHANIRLSYGPLKYLLNNPMMHIWHHVHHLPPERRHGVNFGISLSIWDYLFGTAYIPKEGRDIKLGFDQVETFPRGFWAQITHGFRRSP